MKLFSWIFPSRDREKKSTSAYQQEMSFRDIIMGTSTSASGIEVNHKTALQASVVCACVDVIARGVSQVPFRLMKKTGRDRSYAEEKELYWLMQRGPNPYMSDYDFRYTIAQHTVLTGNAFVWLNRVMGKIVEMYPLTPGSVTVLDDPKNPDGWSKIYQVTLKDNSVITIPNEDMWVIRWRPFDGLFGLDPVKLAREAIGLSMAGEKMASNIYNKGTSINGYLSSEVDLSDEARDILRREWANNYSGVNNSGKVAVLTANLKYNPINQMTAQEAQLIDNRNFQISEICRMFGVQPIMVYHYLNATTYASVEQMFLSHIVHTMTPWYRLIESSANKFLLTPGEFKKGYYFKFFEQGMLRGDMTAMSNWFKTNIEHGVMSPNDCRELMDLNPYDGGDIYLVPLNMSTPDQIVETGELNKKKILSDIENDKETLKIAKQNAERNTDNSSGDNDGNNGNNNNNSEEEGNSDER